MSNMITCPSCQSEFAVTEVLAAQLSAQIRKDMQAELRLKQTEMDNERAKLEAQKLSLAQTQASLEEQIRSGVDRERKAILAEATKAAEARLAVELQDQQSQVQELHSKLKEAQAFELKLRERERKLETEKQELKLAAAREIDAQRNSIREDAQKQFAEEHRLKEAENLKLVSDMRKQIDDLKRKAEQGSQQTQGEVLEIALEQLLQSRFPSDSISPVPKGVSGGDALQKVFCPSGVECGTILWESKRTKGWNNAWLPKLRDDLRASRAHCAIIVSEALPEGVDTFAVIDGVWVCRWSCAVGLAMALRTGMINLGKQRLAEHGRQEKTQLVYGYLSSNEFQQRVTGVVESFIGLQSDLEAEKRSMQRLWAKREKQIQRAVGSMTGMYGDLQGIIGASLPTIDGLTTHFIEADETAGQVSLLSYSGDEPDDSLRKTSVESL